MLESNRRRVQQLTGAEIWLFIIGRGLIAFGVGVLATQYYPTWAATLMWPCIAIGAIAMAFACRGMFRKAPPSTLA